jgi:hypothetical protein
MTSKIIDINENKPHKISIVICLKCFQRWIAVRPISTKLTELECSNCGQGYVIETGENINDTDFK